MKNLRSGRRLAPKCRSILSCCPPVQFQLLFGRWLCSHLDSRLSSAALHWRPATLNMLRLGLRHWVRDIWPSGDSGAGGSAPLLLLRPRQWPLREHGQTMIDRTHLIASHPAHITASSASASSYRETQDASPKRSQAKNSKNPTESRNQLPGIGSRPHIEVRTSAQIAKIVPHWQTYYMAIYVIICSW